MTLLQTQVERREYTCCQAAAFKDFGLSQTQNIFYFTHCSVTFHKQLRLNEKSYL